ncbi:MAG: hypothetical protein U0795_26495 [Pirellulales bacterium]
MMEYLPWTPDVISRELAALAGDSTDEQADAPDGSGTAADQQKPAKKSQSRELVDLCLDLYDLHADEAGEAFAIKKGGPNLAIMLKGVKDALRAELSKEYRRKHGTPPSSSALADAMLSITGEAAESDRQSVHLRYAAHEGGVVIDLGDSTGRAVVVKPGSWEVVERSPVTFRRSALTASLAEPKRPGDVELLRELINIDDRNWRLVVCWLVAAMMCWLARPILLLGGEQGTGKTTLISMLLGVIDRSSAQVMSQPKDLETWAMIASGTATMAVDNISTISGWWSDLLCQTVTGQGVVKRKLYADSDLTVLSFRRVIALTSIDAGSLRGDLADRMLKIDLLPISDHRRLSESDLWRRYDEMAGTVFAGLLDLLASALERMPSVQLDTMPRMADFARVLGALDSDALKWYLDQRDQLADEVLEGDPIAGPVMKLIEMSGGSWEGTNGQLREKLAEMFRKEYETAEKYVKDTTTPRNAPAMRVALKRISPALYRSGYEVEFGNRSPDRERRRLVTLTRRNSSKLSEVSALSDNAEKKALNRGQCVDSVDGRGRSADSRDLNRPAPKPTKTRVSDSVDGVDGLVPTLSVPAVESGSVGQTWGDV